MLRSGASRKQIARVLNAAYAGGLLSEDTFARRLDQLLEGRLIDPFRLIGDLNFRSSRDAGPMRFVGAVLGALRPIRGARIEGRPILLALDWGGGQRELLVGRDQSCDVVISNLSVSRRHARLHFRDGRWILQDLDSTNGTLVNALRVGRCELHPGDRLIFGDEHVRVD